VLMLLAEAALKYTAFWDIQATLLARAFEVTSRFLIRILRLDL